VIRRNETGDFDPTEVEFAAERSWRSVLALIAGPVQRHVPKIDVRPTREVCLGQVPPELSTELPVRTEDQSRTAAIIHTSTVSEADRPMEMAWESADAVGHLRRSGGVSAHHSGGSAARPHRFHAVPP
jgi:hypothetical protein